MENLLKLSFALIFVSMSFIGCSNDNPIASGDPGNGDPDPVVIKTPRYMRIESIKVTGFPETKSNGSDWDGPVCVGDGCKPDIEVILKRDGSLPAFWSDRRKNANHTSTYVFTEPASEDDGDLPFDVPQSQTFKVYLVDDDIGSKDDMGYVTINPASIYTNDNATNFDKALSRNGVKIKVKGAWIY